MEVKRFLLWEHQVWPKDFQPSSHTLLWRKLENDTRDYSLSQHTTNSSWITYVNDKANIPVAYFWDNVYINSTSQDFDIRSTQPFTQSVWLMPTALNGKVSLSFTEQTNSGTNDKSIEIYQDWHVSAYIYPGTEVRVSSPTYTAKVNKWINIIYTYDWEKIKLYINWSKIWEANASYSYDYTNPTISLPRKENNTVWFQGYMSHYICENIAWTDNECNIYFNLTKDRYPIPPQDSYSASVDVRWKTVQQIKDAWFKGIYSKTNQWYKLDSNWFASKWWTNTQAWILYELPRYLDSEDVVTITLEWNWTVSWYYAWNMACWLIDNEAVDWITQWSVSEYNYNLRAQAVVWELDNNRKVGMFYRNGRNNLLTHSWYWTWVSKIILTIDFPNSTITFKQELPSSLVWEWSTTMSDQIKWELLAYSKYIYFTTVEYWSWWCNYIQQISLNIN